ncbi:hypothetical protein HKL94_00945, partial [Candidatus Parcubacteria bacterium]|nr:hypothetical protein [Candidatus Parcubacteria bacterium]
MKKIITYAHKNLSSTFVGPFTVLLEVVFGFSLIFTASMLVPSHARAWSCALSVSASTINGGSSTTLSWTTVDSTSFSINNGVGAVASVSAGSTTVSPTKTTTYVGTAVGAGGSVTCEVTVTVTTPPPPPSAPTCTLSASPTAIQKGSSSMLSWATANATSFSINQSIGAVTSAVSGSKSVSPTTTTTYTGTATGSGGSTTCSATVTVTAPPPPPPTCHTYSVAVDGKIKGSVNKNVATFTIPAGVCPVELSFSSYNLPNGTIYPLTKQVLYDNITNTYAPGTHTVGPLKLACNWQTDL